MKPQRAFTLQRYGANMRGIAFKLTFEEWWDIWVLSGHWPDRGCRKGQYVMARFGDVGPYAVGNVRIISVEENRSEQRYSPERRARIVQALRGNKHGRANKGKTWSVSEAARLRMSMGQQRRWQKHIGGSGG